MTNNRDSLYPEQVPSIDSNSLSLVYDPVQLGISLTDLNAQKDKIEERINRIVERTKVADMPILSSILRMTEDTKELAQLARSIGGIIPLLKDLKVLDRRITALEVQRDDPNFMLWASGSFEDLLVDLDESIPTITED